MRRNIIQIIDRYRKYKRVIVPFGEAAFFTLILFFSYWIRLGEVDKKYIPQIMFLALTFVPVKIAIFWILRLYHISFRYTSIDEINNVLKASFISTAFLSLIIIVSRELSFIDGFPRSIVFIDFMLTSIISSNIRFVFRLIYFPVLKEGRRDRVLIIGAGVAGEKLVRELKTSPLSIHTPVALVDDDPNKRGSIIHGIRVIGNRTDIPKIVKNLKVDTITISIPSASSAQLREIMKYVRESRVKDVKIMPGLFHVLRGNVTLGEIRDLAVEDILGREPVEIELESVASYLVDKRILVTGAGGSIGSELCRLIASFSPSCLIMVDIGDTELFYIDQEIKERFPQMSSVSIIADVKDRMGMKDIFLDYSPQVVFHAAAYKHVPLMETNSREAVLNNIEGTRVPAILSIESGAEKFIFISTDKAINPTSVMGVTKRVAENMIRGLNGKETKFISVRFGNVLESRGSVVPIFKEQIRKGGPVTVTHPDMMRYFMSITEAVFLVLQAGAMGKGGEVFVLDMGNLIRILDLAHDMIRFYGLEPDKDIPIMFTGLRPGEKLFEEILTSEEGTTVTKHKKILVAKDTNNLDPGYIRKVEKLIRLGKNNTFGEGILYLLKELVPTYQLKPISYLDSDIRRQGSTQI